jgi:hypothetical protein
MATPAQNRDTLLKSLRRAHSFLLARKTRTELAGKDPKVRAEAAKCSANLYLAIVELENAVLDDIRGALQANEPALKNATNDIDARTASLNDLEKTLGIIARGLDVVLKVLPGLVLL